MAAESFAIRGGSADAAYLRLAPDQERAVAATVLTSEGSMKLCSAALIAPGVAVASRHCTDHATTPTDLKVVVGADLSAASEFEVQSIVPHPTEDVTIILLTMPIGGVSSFDLPSESVEEFVDGLVQIAGFGLSETGDFGAQRFATARVTEALSTTFEVVAGDEESGGCSGDSGGPAMVRESDGRVVILGVLKGGADSCDGHDSYVRLDVLGPWIRAQADSRLGPPTVACGEITEEGGCFSDVLAFCEQGALRGERCVAPESCVKSATTGRHACSVPEVDRRDCSLKPLAPVRSQKS